VTQDQSLSLDDGIDCRHDRVLAEFSASHGNFDAKNAPASGE
jgi:hypothetical protein